MNPSAQETREGLQRLALAIKPISALDTFLPTIDAAVVLLTPPEAMPEWVWLSPTPAAPAA